MIARIVTGAIASVGFAAAPAIGQQIRNFETEGNLAANVPIGCAALEGVPAGANPVDLYDAALICVRSGDFVKARELVLLGDVRGRFDGGRVTDTTARAAWVVAKQTVQAEFKPKERAGLEAAFRELSDEPVRCALAERLIAQGAPDYIPTYMIQHGMGALMGGKGKSVSDYEDPAKAYAEVVRSYLKCPAAADK